MSTLQLRLIGCGLIVLVIGGMYWRYTHVVHQRDAAEKLVTDLTATLEAERENTRKEHESAQRYAARLAISRGPRSPPAQLMCKLPAHVPHGTAPSGTDAASSPNDGGVPENVDIGPRLDVSFHACEENLIKLEELQRWVLSR